MKQMYVNIYDHEIKKGTTQKHHVDKIYEKFKKMLHKKAWEAWKRTGLPIEDLQSQANLIFCQSYNTHDPARGTFCSQLFVNLHYGLIDYQKKELKKPTVCLEEEKNYIPCFENIHLMASLKSETKKMVEKIFEPSTKLYSNFHHSKITKKNIIKYLQNQEWNNKKIEMFFSEVRSHLI